MKNFSEPYRLQDIFFYCKFWRYIKQIHYLYFDENKEAQDFLYEKIHQILPNTHTYAGVRSCKSIYTRIKPFRDIMNKIPITIDHAVYGEAEFSLWRILQLLDMLDNWYIEYNIQNPAIKPMDLHQLKLLLFWKQWQKQYYEDITTYIQKNHPLNQPKNDS